jgi:NTP pyrophosphatase (non-canonical NTP hydrolase)
MIVFFYNDDYIHINDWKDEISKRKELKGIFFHSLDATDDISKIKTRNICDYIIYGFEPNINYDLTLGQAISGLSKFPEKIIILDLFRRDKEDINLLSDLVFKEGGNVLYSINALTLFFENKLEAEQKAKQEEEKNALDEYQDQAIKFDKEIFFDSPYYFIGLGGEVGEVFEKYKRILRYRDKENIDKNEEKEQEIMRDVAEELGDVLWYVALIAQRCKTSLSEVADMNITKLTKRQQEGTLLATEKREE